MTLKRCIHMKVQNTLWVLYLYDHIMHNQVIFARMIIGLNLVIGLHLEPISVQCTYAITGYGLSRETIKGTLAYVLQENSRSEGLKFQSIC